jgi:Flp pilus assembly protein TadG
MPMFDEMAGDGDARAVRAGLGQERGSAMIEAALVLVVFVLIFLALSDVARMIYAFNEMPYLAREGARYAAVHGSSSAAPLKCADVIAHVRAMAPGLDSSLLTVSVDGQTALSSPVALGAAPQSANVSAVYRLNPIFRVFGASTRVSGQANIPYAQ